jgi:HlyD family secretion protein
LTERLGKLVRAALFAGSLLLAGGAGVVLSRQPHKPAVNVPNAVTSEATASTNAAAQVILAAPARIEGASESINVGAAVDGVLAAVLVREGQQVKAGQTLALTACQDEQARLGTARAAIEIAKQKRERLLRGSRDEERRIAREQWLAAEAAARLSEIQLRRLRGLYETGDAARERLEQAEKEAAVAASALRAAQQQQQLVNAQPLPEELARIEAELAEAEAGLRVIQARLDQCQIKAPQAGTVLRLNLHPGETVSALAAQPVLVLADTSKLFARAEVDERDLAQLFIGQRASISADALAGQTCQGQVRELGRMMGRKRIRSGDPAEKSDRDVLEVLIELADCTVKLPVSLRVTARFESVQR